MRQKNISCDFFIHLSVYFDECDVVVECSLDKVWSNEHLVDCSDLLKRLLLPSVMISYNELYVACVDPKIDYLQWLVQSPRLFLSNLYPITFTLVQ